MKIGVVVPSYSAGPQVRGLLRRLDPGPFPAGLMHHPIARTPARAVTSCIDVSLESGKGDKLQPTIAKRPDTATLVSARDFYNSLAETYDLYYVDWDEEISTQAETIRRLLPDFADHGRRLLDCSCGIGTQALGLAAKDRVVAADFSFASVDRARREGRERKLDLGFAVADMRRLPFANGSFDAVISFDNSLPHLTTEADLRAGLTEMARVLRDEGTLLISVRDYDEARARRPRTTAPSVRDVPGGRFITFQIWHWSDDGERYGFEHIQMEHIYPYEWRVHRRMTTYWALTRAQITVELQAVGLSVVEWLEPSDTGYFQPIVRAGRALRTS
jgi:SAM-dependent methyltransferase